MKKIGLREFNRLIVCVFLLASLFACSTVSESSIKDKPVWRFGVVRIDLEKTDSGAKGLDVMTIGLWSDQQGAGMGYNNARTISLSDSCRLVFVVANKEQLENMKKFLKESDGLNGENICVTKN